MQPVRPQFDQPNRCWRPGTVFRAVASPFVVGNVHLNSGGVFVRFYMRLSAALYLVRVAQ
jgi:hypothetical protein